MQNLLESRACKSQLDHLNHRKALLQLEKEITDLQNIIELSIPLRVEGCSAHSEERMRCAIRLDNRDHELYESEIKKRSLTLRLRLRSGSGLRLSRDRFNIPRKLR